MLHTPVKVRLTCADGCPNATPGVCCDSCVDGCPLIADGYVGGFPCVDASRLNPNQSSESTGFAALSARLLLCCIISFCGLLCVVRALFIWHFSVLCIYSQHLRHLWFAHHHLTCTFSPSPAKFTVHPLLSLCTYFSSP